MTTGATQRNATQRAKWIREGEGQTYIETYRLTMETQSSSHINNLRYIEEENDAAWTTSRGRLRKKDGGRWKIMY